MKSLAFIIVGLGIGLLVAFIFLKGGYQINKVAPYTSPSSASDYTSPPSNASPSATTTVSAGGKLVFAKYTVIIPQVWKYKIENDASDGQDLIIFNGDYNINIRQTASEGSLCVYPGDPDSGIPFKQDYAYFAQITTKDGTPLRRSGNSSTSNAFTVCELKQPDNLYQQPTQYGYTSVKTPANPTAIMLQEVDGILSSLKKN